MSDFHQGVSEDPLYEDVYAEELADEKQREVQQTAEEEHFKECLKYVMGAKVGRDFVRYVLRAARFQEISHSPGEIDTTAFLEGHRNVANQVVAELQACVPEYYLQLLKEKMEEEDNGGRDNAE